MDSEPLLNVADYARAAAGKLPKEVTDYFEGGADEITLGENTAGWERLKLYYRVFAGVGPRDLRTTVLGQAISMPRLRRRPNRRLDWKPQILLALAAFSLRIRA